jgi:hypothetical protein
MDVGQNGLHQLGLDQHWGEEIQLAQLAADTGFDVYGRSSTTSTTTPSAPTTCN